MVTYETNRLLGPDQSTNSKSRVKTTQQMGPEPLAELISYAGRLRDPGNLASVDWYTDMVDRCKTIGPIPSSTINGGEPSVVNGDVVFDPTP